MGRSFSDITIYAGTKEESGLQNYVSDLYVQYMHGYKPPHATRITIQPGFYGIWDRTWKNGAIFAIAVYYSHDHYQSLDKTGKCQYILDLIQEAVLRLCEEYHWDRSVFETAYQSVLDAKFQFRFEYPAKQSRDRKKSARLILEKTETITNVYATIQDSDQTTTVKLFEKKNWFWYDRAYDLVRHGKWLDNDRFGVQGLKGLLTIFYSLQEQEVFCYEGCKQVKIINFDHYYCNERKDAINPATAS